MRAPQRCELLGSCEFFRRYNFLSGWLGGCELFVRHKILGGASPSAAASSSRGTTSSARLRAHTTEDLVPHEDLATVEPSAEEVMPGEELTPLRILCLTKSPQLLSQTPERLHLPRNLCLTKNSQPLSHLLRRLHLSRNSQLPRSAHR